VVEEEDRHVGGRSAGEIDLLMLGTQGIPKSLIPGTKVACRQAHKLVMTNYS
jgi:hypothetical protein